jgi:hypothetical protein
MAGAATDRSLRKELWKVRLRPDRDPRHAKIYQALKNIIDSGSVYYVLTDTPEQMADVFRILVDDKMVVGFELHRDDPEVRPIDVQLYSVEDYRKAIGGGRSEAELRMALELARRQLGQKQDKGQ